jgi:hypothetical protein
LIGKLIFWIFITLISLAFLIYYVARDVPDIVKESKELDKAKLEEQQALKEVKEAYDQCRSSNVKQVCDNAVGDDPNRDEIIHK